MTKTTITFVNMMHKIAVKMEQEMNINLLFVTIVNVYSIHFLFHHRNLLIHTKYMFCIIYLPVSPQDVIMYTTNFIIGLFSFDSTDIHDKSVFSIP